jgi:hypothetical protein
MPPIDTSPQSVVRYLTRLLAALSLEHGGELRISLKNVRQIEQESARQMLCEDTNLESDELVLRFGTKHSAVYPVEPECPSSKTSQASNSQVVQPQPSRPSPSSPHVKSPITPEQEMRLEQALKQRRIKRTLSLVRDEQRQNDSSAR